MKPLVPLRLLLSLFLVAPASAATTWKAGVARENITPGESVWMAGYAARKGPSEGVMQDLHAKALALEDETGGRFVFVTLDLIGVPRELRTALEKHVADKHGLAPEALLLNASHTHSGPMIRLYRPRWAPDEARPPYANIPEDEYPLRTRQTLEYAAFLHEKISSAIDRALASLAPATLTWHRARCGFSMNRRTPVNDGANFKNFPNPDGPVDQEVPVLAVRSTVDRKENAEKLLAVLFGYACHATTLSIMEINGDWPGYAQEYFEEQHPGTVAMFLNGASGDQNPYPRRMVRFVELHGRSMATAIEAALETAPHPVSGPLAGAIAWPEIPYASVPSRENLVERTKLEDRYDRRYAEFLLEELDAGGALPKSYPVPVQVLRFGDSLTLVAMGGEVTVDYALRLKRELSASAGAPVWFAGYSNEVMGYIPSDRVLAEGGYEGSTSMRHVRSTIHSNTWAPGIEKRLIGTVRELLATLNQ